MFNDGGIAPLSARIDRIAEGAGAKRVAVAFHDYHSDVEFAHHGDQWFHAASTIKLPVLFGLFARIDAGELSLTSRLHVRNCFTSAADGRFYRIDAERDAAAELHTHIGRTVRIEELARQMIVASSNLATNLLVDLIGVDVLRRTIAEHGLKGVDLRRGVEDEAAFELGINNRVTAHGLIRVLRAIEENALSPASSDRMLDILHAQEFRSGIPAGLPSEARVANKTGEISTVAHDAGLVYLPDREPYAVAILTEWEPDVVSGRRDTLASISRAVYEYVAEAANA